MEKKSWWKRKSSDRSPGETESSTSISSHSESNSDEKIDHDSLQKSLNHSQSSEVTSRVSTPNTETNNDSFKSLTEKLSAALVNVGAKEDLVKQHAKVAEEAVAGWEKAENEVTTLKQQLESAVQQNLSLEVRTNHLDGALKECVKQLRQAKQEQEDEKHKWELTKKNLETQICNLESKLQIKTPEHTPIDPKILIKLETLEKENSTLKSDLIAQSEELEIRTIERDLSTQAAEIASKQQLESIKKVAKLEAECRKLNSLSRKTVSVNDNSNHKAVSVTSFYVDSLTDSQSDRSEKLDVDSFKVVNKLENNNNENEDSWALALINELDQFKNGKCVAKNVEIGDIMDDFLEMERIASLSEGQNGNFESGDDLKSEVEVMRMRVCELEEKLGELEAEKGELESALKESKENLDEMKSQMVDLQKEVMKVNESKKLVECRLVEMEMEVDLVKGDFEKEKSLSSEMKIKCQKLEKEVVRKTEELKAQQAAISNGELKVKQDLEVAAADRLSECQKTISSLARQLESLATLEDFLIDTANLPGFNGGSSVAKTGVELWKLHSNDTFMPKKTLLPAKEDESNCNPSLDDDVSPSSSSSSTSSSHSKSRNGFEKLFSRSKNGVQGEINQG